MGTEIEEIVDERDSRVERYVWRHVGVKSAREMAEDLGVPPEKVLQVKRALLEEVDILTLQEKRTRLIVELDGMARDARERAERVSDEFFAGGLNAATGAIKAVLVELARMEKADDTKIEALNSHRVKELVSLMNAVVVTGVQEVSDRYGLDEDEVFEIFNARLVEEAEARDAL